MAAPKALVAFWLAVAQQILCASGKLETGTLTLGAAADGASKAAPWLFAGKFGYAIGQGSYDVRVRHSGPAAAGDGAATVDFEVFLDEDWARLQAMEPCRRATLAARKTHVLRLSEDWSPWLGGLLEQKVRPHIWYFAMSACRGDLPSNATTQVDFELRTKQFDTSELSVELRHMPSATAGAVLCLSVFLLRFAAQCRRFRQSAGLVPPVIRVLAAAVLFQWLAQVLHGLNFVAYERNGLGDSTAQTSADVLFMLSQVVSSTLLIVIAQGYTLDRSKDDLLKTMKPCAAVVALLHVLLVGHGKLQGDDADKHHENEGAVGWTLLLVRLSLYAWFLASMRALRRSSGFRLQPFLARFTFVGSLYFLSYPVIYAVVQLFAPYLQHPIMEIGMAMAQTASALWLSDLFFTRGAYYEVSTLSASLLPGGCSPGGSPAGLKRD